MILEFAIPMIIGLNFFEKYFIKIKPAPGNEVGSISF